MSRQAVHLATSKGASEQAIAAAKCKDRHSAGKTAPVPKRCPACACATGRIAEDMFSLKRPFAADDSTIGSQLSKQPAYFDGPKRRVASVATSVARALLATLGTQCSVVSTMCCVPCRPFRFAPVSTASKLAMQWRVHVYSSSCRLCFGSEVSTFLKQQLKCTQVGQPVGPTR